MGYITFSKKLSNTSTVLLPPEVKSAMDVLSASREKMGILPENPFFFAIAKKTTSKLCAWTVLNKYAEKSKASRPELIKSTKLRKYLATTAQVNPLNKSVLRFESKFDQSKQIQRLATLHNLSVR